MPKKSELAPKAEWKGHKLGHPRHEYLSGIPARDLTDEEFAALSDEQRAHLEASGLYTIREDPAEEPPAESKSESKPADKPAETKRGG